MLETIDFFVFRATREYYFNAPHESFFNELALGSDLNGTDLAALNTMVRFPNHYVQYEVTV